MTTTSAADEDWVQSAMKDDTMVSELLMRLHRVQPKLQSAFEIPLEWTVRQRRSASKPVSNNIKPAHRGSPTTPLSWSGGGTSEESSKPKLSRSKANIDDEKPGSKRSRKKKTLAELKEEESLLIKERRELKRQISALNLKFEKQKTANENLKRMKLEMLPHLDEREPEASVSGEILQQKSADNHPKFELPDLNIPLEDSISDVNCGVR